MPSPLLHSRRRLPYVQAKRLIKILDNFECRLALDPNDDIRVKVRAAASALEHGLLPKNKNYRPDEYETVTEG